MTNSTQSLSIASDSAFKVRMREETAAREELEAIFSEHETLTGNKLSLTYDSHSHEHMLAFNGWPCNSIKNRFKRITEALSYIKPYFFA